MLPFPIHSTESYFWTNMKGAAPMVNKPRSRKKTSHRTAYLTVTLAVIVILVIGGWYGYGVLFPPAKPSLVYVKIDTSMGSFEVELFNSSAPKTVANFVSLAESGFYTDLTWHRIEPNFVIQTGDPTTKNGGGNRSTWGQGSSGVQVPFEYDPSLHNYAGYLGMASTGSKVGGTSQFYINLANNTSLDGNYAVFGKVISNMSVVNAIGKVPVEVVGSQNEPVTPVLVYSITMLAKP
jgi:peptidyl-prolyl cis-trans isomerase-like 1